VIAEKIKAVLAFIDQPPLNWVQRQAGTLRKDTEDRVISVRRLKRCSHARLPRGQPAAAAALFLGLAGLFFVRLGGDASRIPSALIGREAPPTDLPPVAGLARDGKPVPGLAATDFKGTVTELNVWASWCVPCHDEAPPLMQLARDAHIRLVGINYKDQADNARRFLGRSGNPFMASGADVSGRAAIEWGVYGVPETFIIGHTTRALTYQWLQGVLRQPMVRFLPVRRGSPGDSPTGSSGPSPCLPALRPPETAGGLCRLPGLKSGAGHGA
jgi:cytochrome c biogenesis protein CcmG, thiol:disulfide interchange protein DsbE